MSEPSTQPLTPWSQLSDAERDRLLADYQCSFAEKLARMQRWLAERPGRSHPNRK